MEISLKNVRKSYRQLFVYVPNKNKRIKRRVEREVTRIDENSINRTLLLLAFMVLLRENDKSLLEQGKQFQGSERMKLNFGLFVEILYTNRIKSSMLYKREIVEQIAKIKYGEESTKKQTYNSLRDMKCSTQALAEEIQRNSFNDQVLKKNLTEILKSVEIEKASEKIAALIYMDEEISKLQKNILNSYFRTRLQDYLFEVLKFSIIKGNNLLPTSLSKTAFIDECNKLIQEGLDRISAEKNIKVEKVDNNENKLFKSAKIIILKYYNFLKFIINMMRTSTDELQSRSKKYKVANTKANSFWEDIDPEMRVYLEYHIIYKKYLKGSFHFFMSLISLLSLFLININTLISSILGILILPILIFYSIVFLFPSLSRILSEFFGLR